MRQLLKRIRTTLRRRPVQSPQEDPIVVSFDEIEMNFGARQVSVSGQDIRLTPKEFLLLRYLVTNPNRAIPHVNLLKAVWGPDYGREVEYLRVFINRIRKKIETNPAKPRYILTEPWFGYRFHLPQKT
jgi:two-component system KDP operon response regulator KdpE